jgi:hypothetical protein
MMNMSCATAFPAIASDKMSGVKLEKLIRKGSPQALEMFGG